MEKDNKNITEPVQISASSTITPTTNQPISQIDRSSWGSIPLTELYEQLNALRDRRWMAADLHYYQVLPQMDRGIAQLETIINQRTQST